MNRHDGGGRKLDDILNAIWRFICITVDGSTQLVYRS